MPPIVMDEFASTIDMDFEEQLASNKENIPSDPVPIEQSSPEEPQFGHEQQQQQHHPQAEAQSPGTTIIIEPPTPGGTGASASAVNPSEEDIGSSREFSLSTSRPTADASTPTLTVRERVKEYSSRTGGGGGGGGGGVGDGRLDDVPDGASLSSSRSSLRTAFDKDDKEWILAASKADEYTMRRLLSTTSNCKRMVNYRFPFNGLTALHFAAKLNKPKCCQFLLENGANPDAKTYAGQTPLHMACFQESRDAIEYLIKLPCRASHTPDYSGKLPHELVRNRDAFADILLQTSGVNMEKRGSFLGELPSRTRADDSLGAVGASSNSLSTSSSSASSSWLSGVRASFRGKSSSGQSKLSLKSAGGAGGSASSQHAGRVASSPAAAAAAVLLAKSKWSQASHNSSVASANLGGCILDGLSISDGHQHHHGHQLHLRWHRHSDAKKKQQRVSKKTL